MKIRDCIIQIWKVVWRATEYIQQGADPGECMSS